MRVAAFLVVFLVAGVCAGENLVPNAGFEQAEGGVPTGWSCNREAASVMEGMAHAGQRCLRVRTDKPINLRSERPYIAIALNDPVPIQGDRVYWVSMWTRCPRYGTGYPCLFYVRWFKEDDTPAAIDKTEVGAARFPHDWQMTRMPVVSPKDAVKARVHLVIWAAYTDLFVDDLGLEAAQTPAPRRREAGDPLGQLRVMYFPEWIETPDEVAKVRDHGFNVASFLYWRCYEQKHSEEIAANLELAKEAKLPALVGVWLSEVAPKEFREKHLLMAEGGVAYKRTPSIFHQEWWDEWFAPVCLRFVKQSGDGSILGLWVDFELYDEPNQVSSVCCCQRCMDEYARAAKVQIEGADVKARVEWLLRNDRMQAFRDFQAERLGRYAAGLRAETDKINPKFVYGNLPYYDYIADRAFAKNLGAKQAPFLIASEYTYRLQTDKYSDATGIQLAVCYCQEMQRRIRELDLHARLLAGICPLTGATFMRDKTVAVCTQADGYWLWTKRIIDRRRAAFGGKALTDAEADAAWAALKEANDRLVAGNR